MPVDSASIHATGACAGDRGEHPAVISSQPTGTDLKHDTAAPYADAAIPPHVPPPITDRRLDELEAELLALGAPAYRARQIFAGLHRRHVRSWDALTDLPRSVRETLAGAFRLSALAVRDVHRSRDQTTKLLLATWDGHLIESVQIPAGRSGTQPARLTVCVSSQAGCALACAFCATGQMGLARNLSPGEIVEQVYLAEEPGGPRRVDNIVFMGMGEPLANLSAVVQAVRILAEPTGYGFSPRRITISTSGLVPQIMRLADQGLPVRLAISLHAPNDELRSRLMPINRRYPIADLLAAAHAYAIRTGRRVSYEYVMLDGTNDALPHARALAQLLQHQPAHVNLIPYNETGSGFRATPRERIEAFAAVLRAQGVPCSIRASRGRDIAAACGQLKARAERYDASPGERIA